MRVARLWQSIGVDSKQKIIVPPEGIVRITDVLAILNKFQNTNLSSVSARVDLLGAVNPKAVVDHIIDIGDVVQGLFAFTAKKYPPVAITGVPTSRPCN